MEKRRCYFRSIVKELLNAAIQLLNAYYKSSTGIEKYVNYIKVKSFRNCLEDITLINNETQNITFNDICNNFADIKYFWLIAHFGGWKSMTLEGLYGTTAILRSRHSKTTAFILPKRKAQ